MIIPKSFYPALIIHLFIVADELDKTNVDAMNSINAICVNLTQNYNIRTVLLTSSPADYAQAFAKEHHLVSEIFYADGVPLKSMVRSNPGVLLIKNGTIINKWHYHTMPTYDEAGEGIYTKAVSAWNLSFSSVLWAAVKLPGAASWPPIWVMILSTLTMCWKNRPG